MKSYIVIDIETAANDRINEYIETVEVRAPSHYRDKTKIEAYREEQLKKIKEKAALHWWTGKVLCVGCKFYPNGGEAFFGGENEKDVLNGFFKVIDKPLDFDLPLILNIIGKSSNDFDVPFLIGRAMANGIGIPEQLRQIPKDKPLTDIDQIFGRSHASGQRTSLDNYAFGMGLPLKLEDSAWIPKAYIGQHVDFWEKLRKHCHADVDVTYAIIEAYEKEFQS